MGPDRRNKLEGCCQNLLTIGHALEEYLAKNPHQSPKGEIVGPDLGVLIPDHFPKLPACPASGTSSYKVLYGPWYDNVDNGDDYFQIWCNSSHHAGYPRYDKPNGLMRAIDDPKRRAN